MFQQKVYNYVYFIEQALFCKEKSKRLCLFCWNE